MTEEERILEEFKAWVDKEASLCSEEGWPNICHLNHSEEGKRSLVEEVFKLVVKEKMGIASALAHVEVMMEERRRRDDGKEERD